MRKDFKVEYRESTILSVVPTLMKMLSITSLCENQLAVVDYIMCHAYMLAHKGFCHNLKIHSTDLQVYLRCARELREDQQIWGSILHSVMEANPAANKWFLYLMCGDSRGLSTQKIPDNLSVNYDHIENYLQWCGVVGPSNLQHKCLAV